MIYTIAHIAKIIGAETLPDSDAVIEHLLLDSRNIKNASSSLFFAIQGPRRDGRQFIPELYRKGVRNFVVNDASDVATLTQANFLIVDNTLAALQQLVAWHRRQFTVLPEGRPLPVIGITGSNGKTIVKEWLYQLLQNDYTIVRSPKSYNSQIGVPMSVWQMNASHNLAIFEAGISQQAEMLQLEKLIQPTIGVLTNIGEAHSEGFNDKAQKLREKMVLFRHCSTVIGRSVDILAGKEVLEMFNDEMQQISWGSETDSVVLIKEIVKTNSNTRISLLVKEALFSFTIPFTDNASIENAITCFCVLWQLGLTEDSIAAKMQLLQPVNMRLELKQGINHCTLINDSYSADLSSLEIALNFLSQQNQSAQKTVILSDLLQTAIPDLELYKLVIAELQKHRVSRLICIGERISFGVQQAIVATNTIDLQLSYYGSTDEFLQQFRQSAFRDEVVLVKGARVFGFEKIVQVLEQQAHQTVLEINLNAIVHNLHQYQALLQPNVKLMAMVKAFAYGSGGAEIAGVLQHHKIDYLGVAYADEGLALRKSGIHLPIMVMNPDENDFAAMVENNLEPVIYTAALLRQLDSYLKNENIQVFPIHIEIETGMNRLGFATTTIALLADELNKTNSFSVRSVFSHLAASEEAVQDDFTQQQFQLFMNAADELSSITGQKFIRHIANSAAILRHPAMQLGMVRLGIGLYGVDTLEKSSLQLQPAATWKSTIAQLKKLPAGTTISYNRKGVLQQESLIATIRLGYADGYPRRLGNGKGRVWIKGKLAPVVGTVCMDMLMIDVSGIAQVQEGDEVIVFGNELPIQELAAWADTIPYEIMTGVSQRVKRIYFEE